MALPTQPDPAPVLRVLPPPPVMDADRRLDGAPGDLDGRAVDEVRRRLRAAGWSVGEASATPRGVRLTFRRRRHGSDRPGRATFTVRGRDEAEAYYNVLSLIAWGEVPGAEDGDAEGTETTGGSEPCWRGSAAARGRWPTSWPGTPPRPSAPSGSCRFKNGPAC
jgi:hypothetical protein